MRRGGLASILFVLTASSAAYAQSADGVSASASDEASAPASPAPVVGYAAMPGGLWAPSAIALPTGSVSVALLGGYGMRNDLIRTDSSLKRMTGRLAVAFSPIEILTIGLSLDGRYDKHSGGEDGYVGDPHLLVRAGKTFGTLAAAGQVDLWVPGKDAPSIAGKAISVAAQGIITLPAGPGLLSFNAGFRLDNSAKSADESPSYSVQDRVSLGVSEFNAVIGGAHLSIPINPQLYVAAEGQVDVFVGEGDTPMGSTTAHEAPSPIVRFGGQVGYHINDQFTALGFVGGARVPKITTADLRDDDFALVPYEPTFSFGVGLQGRFGGGGGSSTPRVVVAPIPVDIMAAVTGEVLDDTGKPIVGAKVIVKNKGFQSEGVTDDKGVYTAEKLKIGQSLEGKETVDDITAEVSVEVSGKKPGKTTLTLKAGTNNAEKITLDPVLPPGQLRAVVRNATNGKPIAGATVKIAGGPSAGESATSAADGTFQIDLVPGTYTITVAASGLKDQTLDVTIDPNGVAIKTIEMR